VSPAPDDRTIADVRAALVRLLVAVRAGELTAPAGMASRLVGAIATLDALQSAPGDKQ
jgi:hypothetical protein